MQPATISLPGTRFLANQEGVVLHTYLDTTGTPTIGIGHTASAGPPVPVQGMTMTTEEAYNLLAADMARVYEPTLRRLLKVGVEQHEWDALDSLVYNIGGGNFTKSTLLARLNAGDRAGAADHFRDWTRSHGVVLPGLVKRREAERTIFLTGSYPGELPAAHETGQAIQRQVTLAQGMSGPAVKTLQMNLRSLGYLIDADGVYGPKTVVTVRAYQERAGLPADGVAGVKTGMAIDAALKARQPSTAPPSIVPGGQDQGRSVAADPPHLTWAERFEALRRAVTGRAA